MFVVAEKNRKSDWNSNCLKSVLRNLQPWLRVVKFRVELPDGDARVLAFIKKLCGDFRLPDLGSDWRNGLANSRGF